MVAEMGDPFVSDYGRTDRRLRVVYDNATESDLLLRSLQRALNKDDVEIVATFKLANINRKRLEALLQKFFGSARLDLELQDRFDLPVKPKEWFLVPLAVIAEVIEKIKQGTIDQFHYDRATASLTRL